MTDETLYIVSAIALAGVVTFLLRAVPFAILSKLKSSFFVNTMGAWMPVGILLILAVVTFHGVALPEPIHTQAALLDLGIAALALAITIAVHLLLGRRTVWSVTAGTACYIALINLL